MAIAAEWNQSALDQVFGFDSSGETPEQRASTSSRLFVRSQIQLALDNPRAKGRRLSALEALDIFGPDVLRELSDKDAIPIIIHEGEPGTTIKARRNEMALPLDQIARVAGIDEQVLKDFEDNRVKLPIRAIESIARLLVLDDSLIGYQRGSGGDPQLGVRLREFIGQANQNINSFTSAMVLRLSEAAWVVKKQLLLQAKLGVNQRKIISDYGIYPDDNYRFPAWKAGFQLAHKTRELLDLGPNEPISSLRDLVEDRLRIPVVQSNFSTRFAGATVAPGDDDRGIVLNICGQNENVWVRRNTLAHELGHLLWDPSRRLNKLVVDEFSDFDDFQSLASTRKDEVEIRANAFAIELLAPRSAVVEVFEQYDDIVEGLRQVMEVFGVSFTAARWQLINANVVSPDSRFPGIDITPTDEWRAREDFTLDYFPVESVAFSRRGKFARVVIDAVERKLISLDTAASCLGCDIDELSGSQKAIKDLFN